MNTPRNRTLSRLPLSDKISRSDRGSSTGAKETYVFLLLAELAFQASASNADAARELEAHAK